MNPNVQVDMITPGAHGLQGHGSTAVRLLNSGLKVSALRTCDVLRKEEWKLFDKAVVDVARPRLVGVGKLLALGLSMNLPNALGTTQLEWETQSDMSGAEVNMSGVTEGQSDRLVWSPVSMPIPIVHKDFNINIRALEASRTLGQPLDTVQAAVAGRKVAETVEAMLFNGVTSIVVGGSQVYGLTTAPNRNTGSVTASWVTATGEQIVGDLQSMIDAANADHMYGPFGVFVPLAVMTNLTNDYKTTSDKTTLTRIMELPGIDFVMATPNLSGTNIVMFQLTPDVIDIIDGLQPTVLQWDSHGGMVINFKVMSILVPRIRETQTLQSGLVHFS